jgi:ribosomal protein S18 acetylase RimI-like enzyme
VWDDPGTPGRLLAWALLSHDGYNTFDVFIQPELHSTSLALQMLDWAEQRLTGILRGLGKDVIRVMCIFEDDRRMSDILHQRGFQSVAGDVHMVCALDEALDLPSVRDEWSVRACRGVEEVEARATAQYGAFGSKAPIDQYIARFRRFMQSGVYQPQWDIVAVGPEGKVGAFCITWPDPVNLVGLFEPVGTHPDFQRQGLGKAVMLEALHRLQQAGMRQAIVSTAADNTPAIKLYESAGFRIVNRLMIYKKQLKE